MRCSRRARVSEHPVDAPAAERCPLGVMKIATRVDGFKQTWMVSTEAELESVLSRRDSRDGAEFWLSQEPEKYPCLALQLGGTQVTLSSFQRMAIRGLDAWEERTCP